MIRCDYYDPGPPPRPGRSTTDAQRLVRVRTAANGLRAAGLDDRAIAASLNAARLPRPTGRQWQAEDIAALLTVRGSRPKPMLSQLHR